MFMGQCEKGCSSGTCGGGPSGCSFRFWFAIFVCDFGLRFWFVIPFVGRERESAETTGERERAGSTKERGEFFSLEY